MNPIAAIHPSRPTNGGASPVQEAIALEQAATAQKIDFAVARKQLDAQQQQGDMVNQLLKANRVAEQQISKGYLDVYV